jgi:hypothetical protein
MNGTGMPTAQEILRFTEEVLRRPEFQRGGGSPGDQPKFLERLLSWLSSIGPLRIGAAGSIFLKTLFILLLVLLVGYLVRLLLSGSGRMTLRRAIGRHKEAAGRERAPAIEGLQISVQRAERALIEGDLRSAVRILYRTLTERLAGRGLLDLAHWKTGLTYLRECPPEAKHYPLLQDTVEAYNSVVYGHYPYDKEKILRLLAELRGWGGQG